MVRKKALASRVKAFLKRPRNLGMLMAEEDQDLARYYVGRERYLDRALDRQDPVVFYMGPKGVGKSAILQMIRLQKSTEKNRIIDLSPDDLAFSAFANLNIASPMLPNPNQGQWLFKTLWDYVLLMELWEKEYANMGNRFGIFKGLFRSKDEKRIKRLFNITVDDRGRASTLTDRIIQLVKEIELSAQAGETAIKGSVKIEHDPSK